MKLFAQGLVIASLVIASTALADTTATVDLGGTVTSTLTLGSTTAGAASGLDLMNGQQIVKVADVVASTNNEQGLTLTASSGSLAKGGGTSIPFQVTSVDEAATPASGAFLIASGSSYTRGTSAAGSINWDLFIMYTPATLQDPGDYTGVIHLSVSDN